MNNPNYKKNDDIRRQNRIVYIILALSLAILAILISVSVISSRKTESGAPETTADPVATENAAVTSGESKTSETESDTAALVTTETMMETEMPTEEVDAGAAAEEVLPDFVPVCDGVILKGFSDTVPVYSQTMEDYRTHMGVDIAAPVGANVYAAATGTVGAVWEDPMNGCSLTLIHKGGAVSTYSNLSRETIEVMKPGMSILGGDVLGTVGDTSIVEIADESHVHYELSVDGIAVDPAEYIDFSGNAENYAE